MVRRKVNSVTRRALGSRAAALAATGLGRVGAGAAALAACAGPGAGGDSAPSRGPSAAPATIEWYKFLTPALAGQAPQFLAEFHASHPATAVKLTIRPGGAVEYMEKLVAMVAAGQPPDALQIHGAAYLAVALGLAQDISDLYRRDKGDPGRFNPVLFQYGSQWQSKT